MKKKSKPTLAKKSAPKEKRTDSWRNLVTGLGTSRDKRMANEVYWQMRTPQEYEDKYAGDELCARIVDSVPDEALRKFVEWTGLEPDEALTVANGTEELNVRGSMENAWKLARAYGGAIQYIVTDTQDPSLPLKEGERVLALTEMSRYDLIVMSSDIESDFAKKNYGYPNYYRLNVQMGVISKTFPIHYSRVIRWDGVRLPRRTYIKNGYWHDSVLNKLINPIGNYQTCNDAVASIIQDFNIGVFKMKQLANLMANGKAGEVQKRLDIISMAKSVLKVMVIDSDSEEYVDLSRNVSGLAEIVSMQGNRLVASTDMPHTKLLGESPDGSSATGNSTTAQWFDYIKSQQENVARPKLKMLMDIIFPQLKGTVGFKFKSLYEMTEVEQSEARFKQAQTDDIYIERGVLDPTEVAMSRFGGDDYSAETELDMEGRENGTVVPGAQFQNNPFGGDENSQDGSDDIKQMSNETMRNVPDAPDPEDSKQPLQTGGSKPFTEKTDSEVMRSVLPPMTQKPLPPQNPSVGAYRFRNQNIASNAPKVEPTVASNDSLPMNDPNYGQYVKAPGIQDLRQTAPSIGDGIVAPSGLAENAPRDLEYIKNLKASLSKPLV